MFRRFIWWLADKLTPLEYTTVVYRTRTSPGYRYLKDLEVLEEDGKWGTVLSAVDPSVVKSYLKNNTKGYKIITKRVPVATRHELKAHLHNGLLPKPFYQ